LSFIGSGFSPRLPPEASEGQHDADAHSTVMMQGTRNSSL